jgi:phosphatidate cytidylyltransferase
MFRQRVLPALVLGAALWWAAGLEREVYLAVVPLFAVWGAAEFYALLRRAGHRPAWALGVPTTALLAVHAALGAHAAFHVLAVSGLLALCWAAWRHTHGDSLLDWCATLAPPLYVGGLLGYFLLLRDLPAGDYWVRAVFLCTWTADIAAFFVGRRWGRTKLAPRLSPHKSWEGALAGGAAAGVAGYLYGAVWPVSGWPVWQLGGLGLLLGAAAPIGDLCESYIKRQLGAKDSSRLLLGHGGLLDRLDSLLVAGMVAYYYVTGVGR